MSQADNLLDSLSVDYTDEPYITVNDDRTITVPDELKHVAVQGDHNIETVTIDCPRYWDEYDFSTMKVYINYMRPDGYKDSYRTKNLRVAEDDDTRILFDWTISGNVTAIKGNLSFLVYIESSKANPCWHSRLNQQMIIDEGLSATEQILRAPDSIEQVLAQTTASYIAEAKAEIEGKTTQSLASIPEDYTAVNNMAEEALREKSNAVKMEAEGKTIIVNDSADNSLLGLKIYGKSTQVTTTGKQLFDASKIPTTKGDEVTLTNNGDGSFTISGTVAKTTVPFSKSKTYTHEETIRLLKAGNITLSSEMVTRPYVYLSLHNSGGRFLELNTADRSSSTGEILAEWLNDPSMYMIMGFYTGANATITAGTVKPMIYQSGNGEWEAFSGGVVSPSPDWPQEMVSIEEPTISLYGKNLVNKVLIGATSTQYGNCLLVGMDHIEPNTTYTISFVAAPGHKMYLNENLFSYQFITGDGTRQSITGTTTSVVSASRESQYTSNHWIVLKNSEGNTVQPAFKDVQIELGDTASDYVENRPVQSVSIDRTLPGIPVTSGGNYTDSDGQQWICDEIDFERGVYVRRINLATLDGDTYTEYIYSEKMGCGQLVVAPNPPKNPSVYSTLCNVATRNDVALESIDGQYYENPANIVLVGSADDTDSSIRTKYESLEVIYALATPIETPLTDAELASFKMVRSNYPSTTVLNDSGAHMAIKYAADTKTYVDNNSLATGTLVDTATGKAYRLAVTNGQLTVVAV